MVVFARRGREARSGTRWACSSRWRPPVSWALATSSGRRASTPGDPQIRCGLDVSIPARPAQAKSIRRPVPSTRGWQRRLPAPSLALLLALTICLAAGTCCLGSLWQFFGPVGQAARSEWWLLLGGVGLAESCLLAGAAILLAQHAGRLARIDRSRESAALVKSLAALRHFWFCAAFTVLVGLILVALVLATLGRSAAPIETVARIWPA